MSKSKVKACETKDRRFRNYLSRAARNMFDSGLFEDEKFTVNQANLIRSLNK